MGTSVIPALIDALYEAASVALPDVNVYDGFGLSADPGDFLLIGVGDPDADDFAPTANSVQDWAHVNTTARDEEGDITCCALSWNGDADPKAARDAAFAITAAVETLLRADYSLGVPEVLWTSYGTSTNLQQLQGPAGAVALVVFTVHFRARI